jgi:ferredoxin
LRASYNDKTLEKKLPLIYNFLKSEEVYELAYAINSNCINCGACVPECPVSCIAEGDNRYVISAEECISCGVCAGACPVDAIVEE